MKPKRDKPSGDSLATNRIWLRIKMTTYACDNQKMKKKTHRFTSENGNFTFFLLINCKQCTRPDKRILITKSEAETSEFVSKFFFKCKRSIILLDTIYLESGELLTADGVSGWSCVKKNCLL